MMRMHYSKLQRIIHLGISIFLNKDRTNIMIKPMHASNNMLRETVSESISDKAAVPIFRTF